MAQDKMSSPCGSVLGKDKFKGADLHAPKISPLGMGLKTFIAEPLA